MVRQPFCLAGSDVRFVKPDLTIEVARVNLIVVGDLQTTPQVQVAPGPQQSVADGTGTGNAEVGVTEFDLLVKEIDIQPQSGEGQLKYTGQTEREFGVHGAVE